MAINIDLETLVELAARTAHEVNRVYCQSLGDDSQVAYGDADVAIRDSARNGMLFLLANPNATPEDQHASWARAKEEAGWVYGEVKDAEANPPTHPCLVPYSDLPESQRIKDYLFQAVGRSLLLGGRGL